MSRGGGELDGLVAVVTGGASGIGLATAHELVGRGATVAVLDLSLDGLPDGWHGYRCDVSDDDSVVGAVAAVVSELGGIDLLVNNAGIGAQGDVAANPSSQWQQVLDVNVVGIARMTAAALPALRRSTAPAVVNMCSIAAVAGLPQRALYSASKGAVLALTRAMAADHVGEGIRVNCVSPGTVNTPWVQRLLAAADDPVAELVALNARQPTRRIVEPEDVALAVAFLASPANRSTTGTNLSVDGGMEALRMPARGAR